MSSQGWFAILVAAVAAARLLELRVSRRHEQALRARGAHEVGAGHYPAMVAVHTAWLIGAPLEVWALERPFLPPLAGPALAAVVAAMALRYRVIATLGERWTTRILVLPGAPLVTGGPFRWLRHPNYLAVVIEIAALPLVHGAWLTALLASAANAAVLAVRIRVEDRALGRTPGTPARGSRP